MQFSFTHEIVFEETGFFSSAITVPSLNWLGLCFCSRDFLMDVTPDTCGSQNLLNVCQQDLLHHWRPGSLGDATTSADYFSVL